MSLIFQVFSKEIFIASVEKCNFTKCQFFMQINFLNFFCVLETRSEKKESFFFVFTLFSLYSIDNSKIKRF